MRGKGSIRNGLVLFAVLSAAMLSSASALNFVLNNGGQFTGASLVFSAAPAQPHTITVTDGTFVGTTITGQDISSIDVVNGTFYDASIDYTMKVAGTPAEEAVRKHKWQGANFVFTTATPTQAVDATFKANIEPFALSTVAVQDLNNFEFNNVRIGGGSCRPQLFSQVDDRSDLPNHNRCTAVGAEIFCGPATRDLIINKYNAVSQNDACGTGDTSAQYVLTKQNALYGNVLPSDANSADLKFCGSVNGVKVDDCQAVTGVATTDVSIGRHLSTSQKFESSTGTIDITLDVEDHPGEAISIWTPLPSDPPATPSCPSRSLVTTAPLKYQGANRFEANGRWSYLGAGSVVVNQGTAQQKTIPTARFRISIGGNDPCATTTAGVSNIKFVVRHEALDGLGAEYVTQTNEATFNLFFTLDTVASIYVTPKIANDVSVYTFPPVAVGAPQNELIFPAQVCILQHGQPEVRVAFNDGGIVYNYSSVQGPLPACAPGDANVGIDCQLAKTHVLDVDCISDQADARQNVGTHCCQNLYVITDLHNEVELTEQIPLVTIENSGTPTIQVEADLDIFLDYLAPQTFTDNAAINVALTTFDGNGDGLNTLDNSVNQPSTQFLANERIVLRFDVTGIDHDAEPWNKYAIDVVFADACGTEGEFTSYEFSNKHQAGCKGFSGAAQQVENYLNIFNPACNDLSAGQTGHGYCNEAPLRNFRRATNYVSIGRCSDTGAHCQIAGRTAINSFGYATCAAPAVCEAFNGDATNAVTGFDDIGTLDASFGTQYCRAAGQTTWSVSTPADFPTCSHVAGSPNEASTTCVAASECSRTTATEYLAIDIPTFTFGNQLNESATYFNFDVVVYRTLDLSHPTARRLLSAGQPHTEAITVRKSMSVMPHAVGESSQLRAVAGAPRSATSVNTPANKAKIAARARSAMASAGRAGKRNVEIAASGASANGVPPPAEAAEDESSGSFLDTAAGKMTSVVLLVYGIAVVGFMAQRRRTRRKQADEAMMEMASVSSPTLGSGGSHTVAGASPEASPASLTE